MKNAFGLSGKVIALAAALLFAGCLGDGDGGSEVATKNELEAAGEALFDLPSSLHAADASVAEDALAKGALMKTAGMADSVAVEALEPYRLVPGYLHVAESAKLSLKSLLTDLAAEEWPEEWEGMTEQGYWVRTVARDSSLDGDSGLRFRSLAMSKEGEPVLWVSYFRNARGEFSGTFVWRSEGVDSTRVAVRFNGRNADLLGERLVVAMRRGVATLENVNAPASVRVVAVRKENRVALSAISYHPTWQDHDTNGVSFWGEGPKVFAVRAVANTDKDVALLKVAFADTSAVAGSLFTEHLLDNATRVRAAVHMRSLMMENDTLNRLVWWALDREKSLQAPQSNVADGLDFLAYTDARSPESLTAEEAWRVLSNSRSDILAGDDRGLKVLYWTMALRQPIFLASGARIVGAGSMGSGFGLEVSELESDAVELPDVSDALDASELEFPTGL